MRIIVGMWIYEIANHGEVMKAEHGRQDARKLLLTYELEGNIFLPWPRTSHMCKTLASFNIEMCNSN